MQRAFNVKAKTQRNYYCRQNFCMTEMTKHCYYDYYYYYYYYHCQCHTMAKAIKKMVKTYKFYARTCRVLKKYAKKSNQKDKCKSPEKAIELNAIQRRQLGFFFIISSVK